MSFITTPFEHNPSCATRKAWLDHGMAGCLMNEPEPDAGRVQRNQLAGAQSLPVQSHAFGLDLSEEERKALIIFLRTV